MADSDAKEFDLASSDYTEIRVVASGAVASGEFVPDATYATPHHFAIAEAEAADDEYAAVIKAGRVKVAVDTGIVATAGQKAYFIAADNEVTDVAADGDYFIGYFAEAVAATDTHGYIVFDGTIESNAIGVGAVVGAGMELGDISDVDLATSAPANTEQLTYISADTNWQPKPADDGAD